MADTPKQAAQAPQAPSFGIQYNVSAKNTAVLDKVDKFGSAGKAGLAAGDEIVALNGTKLPAKAKEFIDEIVLKTGVGGTLKVSFLRQGKQMELSVKLGAKKALNLDLEEVSEVLERKISPASGA